MDATWAKSGGQAVFLGFSQDQRGAANPPQTSQGGANRFRVAIFKVTCCPNWFIFRMWAWNWPKSTRNTRRPGPPGPKWARLQSVEILDLWPIDDVETHSISTHVFDIYLLCSNRPIYHFNKPINPATWTFRQNLPLKCRGASSSLETTAAWANLLVFSDQFFAGLGRP